MSGVVDSEDKRARTITIKSTRYRVSEVQVLTPCAIVLCNRDPVRTPFHLLHLVYLMISCPWPPSGNTCGTSISETSCLFSNQVTYMGYYGKEILVLRAFCCRRVRVRDLALRDRILLLAWMWKDLELVFPFVHCGNCCLSSYIMFG
jgi:hypothetical protein